MSGCRALIVTMDDTTSRIYSAFLVGEEGTASTFRALLAVFRGHGKVARYTASGELIEPTPAAKPSEQAAWSAATQPKPVDLWTTATRLTHNSTGTPTTAADN